MSTTIPKIMNAAAINRFGDVDQITTQQLPVPTIDPDEILIRVEAAGVGVWDPEERQGKLVEMMEHKPKFPYILGSDGAGTVAAIGNRVHHFKAGDAVYGFGFLNPKGGFYAEYTAIKADNASKIPGKLTKVQAAAMPYDAMTALRGLDDTLKLKPGESILIFGASGGIGHLAVQLAKRMGARVLAIASGHDGVALVKQLGADAAVDGKTGDVTAAARAFAPAGIDTALVTTNGKTLPDALATLRPGGRVAFPNGVEPQPQARPGITVQSHDGMPDPTAIEKLNTLINAGPFDVQIFRIFPLNQAPEAHQALTQHHLGKLALQLTG
jgi:NADPH2:quinone reductase